MRASLLVLTLAPLLVLAACEKETAQGAPPAATVAGAPPAPGSGPQAVQSAIDWAAARADRAKAPVNDAPVTIQSADGAAGGLPKVPVLLPSGIVQTQSAGPPALVSTDDGYFATYKTPKYDAIVNGSMQAYKTGQTSAAAKGDLKFTQSEAGAQLSFSRYGADYLIQFECHEADGATSCITEDEAKAFADSLFVQQTQ
ncbi:MAG: hypothetical protein GC155_13730 [Alphaproteobacteria bacterium]|nr:hypothetical protein [Alphaproteobacteria bacterium]